MTLEHNDFRRPKIITILLLVAVALIGFAHIAFLPPWEGFDETAHWSYVQELADTGHSPRYAIDGIAADVATYRGPMPYGAAPPFDQTGRPTFRSYRQAGASPIPGAPSRYASTPNGNWQAQHPPLYYVLMVPAYRATHGLGWIDHLLVLRVASFALALAGLIIGVWATVRSKVLGPWGGPLMAAWPFLFPQFFPEFARLGNDSLCLLLVSVLWGLLLGRLAGRGGWISALGLGLTLGLGLLTKAFFLPIGAGVSVMLLARWWISGRRSADLLQIAVVGVVALALGGWWYIGKALQTGSLTGSDEFIRLSLAGGMGRLAQGFSLGGLVRGLLVIPATFVWAGTWSLARLPEVLLLPSLLLLVIALFDYASRLRLGPAGANDLAAWAPVALAIPMLAGLVYHVLVWMAGTSAVTPGWYLHILAAPLGFAVARGWVRTRLLTALLALTVLYTVVAWAFQLSLFSGCATKLGADKHYSLAGGGCFLDLHALGALGHPVMGLATLGAGVLLALGAAALAWRPSFAQDDELVALSSI